MTSSSFSKVITKSRCETKTDIIVLPLMCSYNFLVVVSDVKFMNPNIERKKKQAHQRMMYCVINVYVVLYLCVGNKLHTVL